MNVSDSERIAAVLESIKYKPVQKIEPADLVVVNMCSVRQSAVDRVFGLNQKLVKLKNHNPQLTTILTGCVLKKDEKKLSRFFDYIINIKDIGKLPKILRNKNEGKKDYLRIKPAHVNKFSAIVPIMTGCNNFCAYCVVPYTRGKEVSRPAKDIICEIKNLIKRGYKEIWLMGQNVNSYGVQRETDAKQNAKLMRNKINFPKLLKMVNNIPGNFWIRFTSSHPKPSTRAKLSAGLVPYRNKVSGTGDFSWNELINIIAKGEKITPYLNLPVQAGDDKVLKRMNRPYTIKQYINIIKKVGKKIPDICLSTDIIVGFPGETKKQFQNSVKLFKEINYDMAYISEYSPRPKTMSAKMKDDISIEEKSERKRILNNILKETALGKNKRYVNKVVEVLPMEYKNGLLFGKSWHYKTVKFKGNKNLIGKFVKVKITNALPWILEGKIEYRI